MNGNVLCQRDARLYEGAVIVKVTTSLTGKGHLRVSTPTGSVNERNSSAATARKRMTSRFENLEGAIVREVDHAA